MADGFVQAPADNVGKKADTESLTTQSGAVERIRVSIKDSVTVNSEILEQLLDEMRTTNILLAQGFGLDSRTTSD